jgi:hypothetical protein
MVQNLLGNPENFSVAARLTVSQTGQAFNEISEVRKEK